MIKQVAKNMTEKQLVKIVFQDESQEDRQLNITVYGKKNEEDKTTSLSINVAPADADAHTYNPFVIRMFYDTLDTLLKAKMEYDKTGEYPGLHVLTRAEYKEYVTKVLGVKIPENDNTSN